MGTAVRTMCSGLLALGDGGLSSEFGPDVSDTRRLSSASDDSEFSTDVSDTRRVKYSKVKEGRDNQESFHRA